jgi:hypothetical protein
VREDLRVRAHRVVGTHGNANVRAEREADRRPVCRGDGVRSLTAIGLGAGQGGHEPGTGRGHGGDRGLVQGDTVFDAARAATR